MRKDDAFLTFTCDVRDLATAASFFIAQGARPRSKSELGRMIVREYALALRANNAVEYVDTATAADEIITELFGSGANPGGRLGPTLLINKQVERGITPEETRRITKKYAKEPAPEEKPDKKKIILETAKYLHQTGKLQFIEPWEEQEQFLLALEKEGLIPQGTTASAKESYPTRIAHKHKIKPSAAECIPDSVTSTEDPEERARRDKEQLDALKTAAPKKPEDL